MPRIWKISTSTVGGRVPPSDVKSCGDFRVFTHKSHHKEILGHTLKEVLRARDVLDTPVQTRGTVDREVEPVWAGMVRVTTGRRTKTVSLFTSHLRVGTSLHVRTENYANSKRNLQKIRKTQKKNKLRLS